MRVSRASRGGVGCALGHGGGQPGRGRLNQYFGPMPGCQRRHCRIGGDDQHAIDARRGVKHDQQVIEEMTDETGALLS